MVRDFPLESVHSHAFKAAEATHCAGETGKYWGMHERLFAHQRALSPADLLAHAQALGVDAAAVAECLNSGRHADRVRRGIAEGEQAGVRGTPTFFLAVAEPGAPTLRVLRVIRGAQPFAAFKAAIDGALAAPR